MYHKWWSYDLWFLRYQAWQIEFFLILDHFLPLYTPSPTPNNSENQSFQKMKKTPRDIIILHKRTINGSWDMKCTKHIFFVILCHFFPLLQPEKMKISKKWKKTWRYHHFTQVYQNSWSYAILFLRYGVWLMYCYFSFWAIFFLFTNEKKWNSPKHENFKKMKKKAWRYHFMQIMITYYTVLEIWHVKHVIVIFHFGLFFALLPPSPLSPTWRYHFTHAYRKLWLVDVRFLRHGERRTDGKGDI